jgi:diaminopimelate epimerase
LFKVEGAGNDFILGVGAWADRLASEPELVSRLCHRRFGLGADGTLAVSPLTDDRVRLVYRNADGNEALFCANGTRSAARAAVELLGFPSRLTVETDWASIPAEVRGATVTLELPPPGSLRLISTIEVSAPISDLESLEVGVPHLVGAASGLADLDMARLAPPLRFHSALGPKGANVHFYEIRDDGALAVRSWERGVEGETMCCGSGLVEVALRVMARRRLERVEVIPQSGARLVVEALGDPPNCRTRLTGPTRMVAEIIPAAELFASS